MSNSEKKIRNAYLEGIVIVLFLLYIFSLMGHPLFLGLIGSKKMDGTAFTLSRISYWVAVLVLWFHARKIEKGNLLLWEEKKYNFGYYLLSLLALFGAIIIGVLILRILLYSFGVRETNNKMVLILEIFKNNHLLIIFTCITAGVTEELIFRGYMQPRIEFISKNKYVGMVVSAALFGLLHYKYGTVINVLGPFVIGLIFAYYYSRFRNIKVLIICHILWDLMSIYLLILYSTIKR